MDIFFFVMIVIILLMLFGAFTINGWIILAAVLAALVLLVRGSRR